MQEYHIIKSSYEFAQEEYNSLLQEHQLLKEKIRASEDYTTSQKEFTLRNRQKEDKYEDTIRELTRRNDELVF